MEVRYATWEDYPEFEKLHAQFFYAGNSDVRPNITVPANMFIELVITQSMFLAFEQDEMIGYAVMQGYTDGSCKIQEFFIKPSKQRKGFGRQFVEEIKKRAKEEDFSRIELMSATMETDRFWEKCRFLSVGGSDLYILNLESE